MTSQPLGQSVDAEVGQVQQGICISPLWRRHDEYFEPSGFIPASDVLGSLLDLDRSAELEKKGYITRLFSPSGVLLTRF